MNKTMALRLIHPFGEGSEIRPGISLVAIDVQHGRKDYRKDRAHLVFSSGLTLTIRTRDTKGATFTTHHFSVSIHQGTTALSDRDKQVISTIQKRIKANDTTPPKDWVHDLIHDEIEQTNTANIWLVPGHIGNPLDLSVRSLRVLKSVDVIAVEAGSENHVDHIFDVFDLGPTPPIFTIEDNANDDNKMMIMELLENVRSKGQSLALFGANEGAPGVCDPGWRLLHAAHQLKPEPTITTISGGSAITTALMYAATNTFAFSFMGLLVNGNGDSLFMRTLAGLRPWSEDRTFICFAEGTQLREQWNRLGRVTRGLQGSMSLLVNVSLPNEYTKRFRLSDFARSPPDVLAPNDKIVLRIDLDWRQRGLSPFFRMLRNLFSSWRF